MTAGIRITLDDRPLAQALAGMINAGEDLTPAWKDIGASLVTSTQNRFETETGPDGSPWPASVRALMEGGQTLTDTARLRQSITYVATSSSVEVGTDVVYAGVHQGGMTIRPKSAERLSFRIGGAWVSAKEVTIPARPFVGIDDSDETEIIAILGDHVMRPAKAAEGTP